MAETPRKETVEVVLKNWRAEVETAQVYRDLAARESDEKRKGILIRMAEAEERHARRWEQKLREMDEPVPVLTENIWDSVQTTIHAFTWDRHRDSSNGSGGGKT
jgi:rubrerythrin